MSRNVEAVHAAASSLGALGFVELVGLSPARGSNTGRARCLCPVHADRHPSCDVAVRNGRIMWLCRSCAARGDTIGFIAAIERLDARADFRRVLEVASSLLGVTLENDRAFSRRVGRRAVVDPSVALAVTIDRAAEDWLSGRDFPPFSPTEPHLVAEALANLRDVDALDDEQSNALDALAPRILAEISAREDAELAKLAEKPATPEPAT